MENDVTEKVVYHPITSVEGLSESLKSVFDASWITTVEQAVGFLSVIDMDVDGKDAFLACARDVLGEEAFLKYSSPAEQPPLGCKMPIPAVEVATGDLLPENTGETSQTNQTECLNKPEEGHDDENAEK